MIIFFFSPRKDYTVYTFNNFEAKKERIIKLGFKSMQSTNIILPYLPKSQSFNTAVSGSKSKFCGLISRWHTPNE